MRTGLDKPRAPAETAEVSPVRGGIGGAAAAEWRRVLTTRSAFGLMILGPVLYGVLYPQPYLTQILRDVPIAVVDNDLNDLSLELIEALDASGSVKVSLRADTLEDARRALDRGKVFAIVGIAPNTERDVLKGNTVGLPVYIDATYLFLYKSAAAASPTPSRAWCRACAAGGARTDGSLAQAALAATLPADILLQPIFNPVGGYASYVVPAAFVLILQQTLLMGAALLTGPALDAPVRGPSPRYWGAPRRT